MVWAVLGPFASTMLLPIMRGISEVIYLLGGAIALWAAATSFVAWRPLPPARTATQVFRTATRVSLPVWDVASFTAMLLGAAFEIVGRQRVRWVL